ncbi:MAG: hypothetical protein WA681_08110, partial [Candidatus Acidiferrales bacterium]
MGKISCTNRELYVWNPPCEGAKKRKTGKPPEEPTNVSAVGLEDEKEPSGVDHDQGPTMLSVSGSTSNVPVTVAVLLPPQAETSLLQLTVPVKFTMTTSMESALADLAHMNKDTT